MGIRERLERHRVATATLASLVILAAIVFVVWDAGGSSGGARRSTKEYFSVDDGKTWFAEEGSKLPPFEHNGKTAYRVRLFKCPGKPAFASYLERYAEADKRRLEASMAKSAQPTGPAAMERIMLAGSVEVKKPGDANWVRLTPATAEQHHRTTHPTCPDGSTADMQPVLPD